MQNHRKLWLSSSLALLIHGFSMANPLPSQAVIVYKANLGGFPVGEATQRWTLNNGRYELNTELRPILGPDIRYQSTGDVTEKGLKPSDYAEFRSRNKQPRTQAKFDWDKQEVTYGKTESLQTGKLSIGAQDLNALPFQLSWLGSKPAPVMQVMTGRKLREDHFKEAAPNKLTLMGKSHTTRVWISPDGTEATEIWLAPTLGNLPVKIIRHDDKGELQLVAKTIEYQLD
ncbi:DUF3108 domain-containing protein [Chitinimonas sp. BJB300]|uniref:DUF3108 domain-containing protein n=1 Tax=Chitinimonas sp. BJB300 TaxID=1559339 RepID=UPI000C10C677|nr:DUF3108 domain-containing protein [Chitinimonas sp. BJB300]PHV11291.1 hypothetical protein CSQ89_11665 [Chitinimonas sp. BJB300]TSJ91562.1 DUF3108 domain-containing protein [Chitinimonas sp. BJB300]